MEYSVFSKCLRLEKEKLYARENELQTVIADINRMKTEGQVNSEEGTERVRDLQRQVNMVTK